MKLLDLFSGIGGFSLGLEKSGFETVAFCEIEKYPRKVLKKHWPGIPIAGDIKKLNYKGGVLFYEGEEIYRGSIDAVCGGFPCQPHSYSGKRLASNDSRDLWSEMFRLISEISPRIVIGENVLGLLTSESGRYFGGILKNISSIGYDAEWFNLPAGAIGAEHLRPRIWILAYPNQTQFKGGCISERIQQEYANSSYTRWGKDKPGVERTLNGIPRQMDRLGCLGNAIVPEIPSLIGRAIRNTLLITNKS